MPLLLLFVISFVSFAQDTSPTLIDEKAAKALLEGYFKNENKENLGNLIKNMDQGVEVTAVACDQPKKNRFESINEALLKDCEENLKYIFADKLCQEVVQDVFEIGSPDCNEGEAGAAAGSCTMGENFLVRQFSEDKDQKYSKAISKIDEVLQKVQKGEVILTQDSIFDIILDASNNDKTLAINIITAGEIGFAGFSSFSSKLKGKVSSEMLQIIQRWGQAGGMKNLIKEKYPNATLIPEGHIKAVKKEKSYHYWPRAMIAANLKDKGYPSIISRSIATATSMYYEFYLDWKEHAQQGVGVKANFDAALADVRLSDCGSQLGSGLTMNINDCEPSLLDRIKEKIFK